MRHVTSLLMVSVLMLVIGLSCQQKPGKVLVKAGSEAITDSDIELLTKVNPRIKRRLETPAGKKQILDNYVEQALMYQEAKRQGLSRDPMVRAKIKLYNKVILAQSLLESKLEGATKKYYDEHKDEFEKIKIAHIYIPFKGKEKNRALGDKGDVERSEEQAKQLIEKISADLKASPDKFAEVAGKDSEDPKTKQKGGELGWLAANDVRMGRWGWAKVIEASLSLPTGTISESIRSDNGFHLVKVMEPKKTDDFKDVKARIRFKLQAQTKSDLIDDLKKQYDVSYADETESEAVEKAAENAAEKAPETPPAKPEPASEGGEQG
jgi:parvulin-like peptidyl-prolyl isomerase